MHDFFRRFARRISDIAGSPWTFTASLMVIIVWALVGPAFDYSDTWQLSINTGTTIITFLMVFLIQNTQNRDSRASHLKLDELLRAIGRARSEFSETEHMSDAELAGLEAEFTHLAEKIAAKRAKRELRKS